MQIRPPIKGEFGYFRGNVANSTRFYFRGTKSVSKGACTTGCYQANQAALVPAQQNRLAANDNVIEGKVPMAMRTLFPQFVGIVPRHLVAEYLKNSSRKSVQIYL